MAASLLISTILIPLVLGLALAFAAVAAKGRVPVLAAVALVAILVVYYALEGMPPFPPVSSKHKIFYVFLVLGLVGIAASRLRFATGPAATGLLLLAALFWIAQKKIMADPLQLELGLAVLPVIGAVLAAAAPARQKDDAFLWPAALISVAISGSLVSILGGYIGLAQMLGAFAALVGGAMAVAYLLIHLLDRKAAFPSLAPALWILIAAVSAILISIAVFASKLSTLAFVLVNLTYLTPLIGARFLGSARWWAPFAMAAVSAVPALLAIAAALLNSN